MQRPTTRSARALIALTCLATSAAAQIQFSNDAKTYAVKIFGRIHNEWTAIRGDDSLGATFQDGNEFRRARIGVSGSATKRLFFKVDYDFEDGMADFKDVYMGVKTPAGRIRMGHFKESFSLEQLESTNNNVLIERSLHESFSPARNTGFDLMDTTEDKRVFWAIGMFRDTDKFGDSQGEGEYNFTGRLAGTPIWRKKGKQYLHVAASVSVRSPNDNTYRIKQNRQAKLAPVLGDTGKLASDGVTLANLEVVWVHDAFSIQAEHAIAEVSSSTPGMSDLSFSGSYVQVAYTLTGEHRRYKTSEAKMKGLKPRRPWGEDGYGAWELALRYSMVDLTDGSVVGGELNSVTLGVNWYMNKHARIMLNVVRTERDASPAGDMLAAVVRFQLTW